MFSFLKQFFSNRDSASVAKTDVDDLALYHFSGCPYCRAVRKQIEKLNLNIELRNIYDNNEYLAELVKHGGKKTVPCLRIAQSDGEVIWMYESMDIIEYLRKRFG